MLAGHLALVVAAIFTGAALYINVVDGAADRIPHRYRMGLRFQLASSGARRQRTRWYVP